MNRLRKSWGGGGGRKQCVSSRCQRIAALESPRLVSQIMHNEINAHRRCSVASIAAELHIPAAVQAACRCARCETRAHLWPRAAMAIDGSTPATWLTHGQRPRHGVYRVISGLTRRTHRELQQT
jgi:hypothetical protein